MLDFGFEPGCRIRTATGRTGTVCSSVEYGEPERSGQLLVKFDHDVAPTWILEALCQPA